eukprot:Skav218080  [mRNA]  locus=scaffold3382:13254:23272:- [translate_table: standard]
MRPSLIIASIIGVIIILAATCHMFQGQTNALRTPPAWGPEQEMQYPFRQWSRDIMLWSIATELEPARKAASVLLVLKGAAKELGRQIPPQAVVEGGVINGVQVDPLTYFMHALQERFGNLGEEVRMQAITELMGFARRGHEPIDALLVRFDSIRARAAEQGGAVVSVQGITWILLRAIGISDHQLIQLLAPYGGLFPATEAELTQLKMSLRRMGHILERTPGNLREGLRPSQGNPSNAFLAHDGHWESAHDPARHDHHEYPEWSQYQTYAAAQAPHGEVYATQFDDEDIDTDSNTSSGAVSSIPEDAYDPTRTAQDLFWAYRHAKHKWRKYMQKPTRAVRRYVKRFDRRKGKGKGKGKSHQSAFAAGKGKGKKGKNTISKGKGRRANPRGPDGQVMRCYECGSTEHLAGACPRRNQPSTSSNPGSTTFFTRSSVDQAPLLGPLAGIIDGSELYHAIQAPNHTVTFATHADNHQSSATHTYRAFMTHDPNTETDPLIGNDPWSSNTSQSWSLPTTQPQSYGPTVAESQPIPTPSTSSYGPMSFLRFPFSNRRAPAAASEPPTPQDRDTNAELRSPQVRVPLEPSDSLPSGCHVVARYRIPDSPDQSHESVPHASRPSTPDRPIRNPDAFHIYTPPTQRTRAESYSPEAGTPFLSPENFHSQFPWWPGEEADRTAAYHAISIPNRAGIIIDPGAFTNLIGEDTARAFAQLAMEQGFKPRQWRMKPMFVQGVGEGQQKCEWTVSIPIACKLSVGGQTCSLNHFEAPVVGGSGSKLPALLGLRSLTALNATLRMQESHEALYVPLPGADVEDLSNCRQCPLSKAPSGHLIMTIDHWSELRQDTRSGIPPEPIVLHIDPARPFGDASRNTDVPTRPSTEAVSVEVIKQMVTMIQSSPQDHPKRSEAAEKPQKRLTPGSPEICRQNLCRDTDLADLVGSTERAHVSRPEQTSDPQHTVHHDTPDCDMTRNVQHVEYAECSTCHILMHITQSQCQCCETPNTHAVFRSQQAVAPDDSAPNLCFPTEEKIKQKTRLKRMKAAGERPKTRAVHVESHFDDCGTDYSSLAPYLTDDKDNVRNLPQENIALYTAVESMHGFDLRKLSSHTYQANSMETVLHVLSSLSSRLDVVEICGGAARTSTISIRKHLRVGENFDLITDCDLNDPRQQQLVMQYFLDHKPLVAVMSPRCCIQHRPYGHPAHTHKEDCKHAVIAHRLGVPRKGRHPRPPNQPASASISADLQSQLADNSDLATLRTPATRNRRTFQEVGVGEHPSDWSRFNVGRSLQALSAGSSATRMRELRKLHLRWWHCGKESMRRVLAAAGLPKEILDMIPGVIDTCRECRKWSRPANETVPTLRMTAAFNEHVEVDLLFYREHVIFHLICCGTRWHAATVVRSKQEEALLSALDRIWLAIHGPMQQLISDGESGLTNTSAQSRLKRLGITLKVRAPGQHARFIERRGAILRTTLHCIESQLVREGIQASMEAVLSEAVFAGNALVHVGGVTPYQCLYGRTPALLPPLPAEDSKEFDELSDEADRARDHIRTAALEAMIQATSLARTARALKSRAIAATEIVYNRGDLVDYHRPTTKDASGWHGPAEVLEYKPEDGVVVIKLNGQPKPCRLQDVRHTLFAHVSLQVFVTMPTKQALEVVKTFAQKLPLRKLVTIGMLTNEEGDCHVTHSTTNNGQLLEALNHLVEHAWCFDECQAIRIGHGCKSLPSLPNVTHSTLLYWDSQTITEPLVFIADRSQLSLVEIIGAKWETSSIVQLLHNSENPSGLCESIDASASSHGLEDDGNTVLPEPENERLSTIAEGSNEDQNSDGQDPEFTAFLTNNFSSISSTVDEADRSTYYDLWMLHQDTVQSPTEQEVEDIPIVYVPPQDNLEPSIPESPHSLPTVDPSEPHVTELLILPQLSNCFGDAQILQDDEMFTIKVYNTVSKVEVVKRASDILSKDELLKHKDKVEAAILDELKIWDGYGCFKMVPRKGAHNIIDSRFVAKWKVKDTSRPYESRVIRMRMALRGFKEWCADSLDTYAATGSKVSQRLLLSEAACHPTWSFLSLDINKAFLQGLTYEELSQLTGQEERIVHFTLPHGSAAILRRIPGYENYDERYHVLRCVKPGTGCKDAPRAFNLKLAGVTRSPKIGLKPLSADPECEVKHKGGKLVLILVKHVDDIKIAGEEEEVQLLLKALEETFGHSDRNDNNFTCVGIHHVRKADGTISLDQDEYISALKQIQHPDITGRPQEELCTETVKRLYWSLLGAVAYTLLTQHWLAIYIIALQRQTHKPQYQHIRKLNSWVKALQKHKIKVIYPGMKCSKHIIAYSDASFCKETESKGYGVRGSVFIRCGTQGGNEVCHVIDASSQSLKLVTRSTFSSETLAAVGTVDALIPLAISFHEITRGPLSPQELRAAREQSDFNFKTTLVVDALNLFATWTSSSVKLPSEKSLFPHLMWLRDVTKCVPSHLRWSDTRDMLADALTKGSIQRTEILAAMIGKYEFRHPFKEHHFTRKDQLNLDSAH